MRPKRTPRSAPAPRSSGATGPKARDRFLRADRYRIEREWLRYEGTPQRDLFRVLRERFIERNARKATWSLDVGSGPGRFTSAITAAAGRTVALDLSRGALDRLAEKWTPSPDGPPMPDRVRADGAIPPLRPGAFGTVAVLGNSLGFAAEESDELLDATAGLVGPGGHLLLEIAPGPGESSRYLGRLPVRSVGRLFAAPPAALLPRIEREGYRLEPRRKDREGEFHRWSIGHLRERLPTDGWERLESLAVAPALGADAERIAAVGSNDRSWGNLLAVEEELGRREARWNSAAAVLVALRRIPVQAYD